MIMMMMTIRTTTAASTMMRKCRAPNVCVCLCMCFSADEMNIVPLLMMKMHDDNEKSVQ